MGWFNRKPKAAPVPPAAPVMPKFNFEDFYRVTLNLDSVPGAQDRAKGYVHKTVTDFRTTKDVQVRWLVKPVKGGDVGFFLGRTMMVDVTPDELLTGVMARAAALNAPLMLDGYYAWDYKAGPFEACVYLPKDPQSVEMVTVS